jgi:hypothetical protein
MEPRSRLFDSGLGEVKQTQAQLKSFKDLCAAKSVQLDEQKARADQLEKKLRLKHGIMPIGSGSASLSKDEQLEYFKTKVKLLNDKITCTSCYQQEK